MIFVGHSDLQHMGVAPLDQLLATAAKREAAAIIFLGCHVVSPREGDVLRFTHSPAGNDTIVAGFQRIVWTHDEAMSDNGPLVQATRAFLHQPNLQQLTPRSAARHAFAQAIGTARAEQPAVVRPELFFNDADDVEPSLAYMFELVEQARTDNVGDGSLWMLELVRDYHEWTCCPPGKTKPVDTLKAGKAAGGWSGVLAAAKEVVEQYALHTISILAAAARSAEVWDETVEQMRKGAWEQVPPLQFCLAMVQGYHGPNSWGIVFVWTLCKLHQLMHEQSSFVRLMACTMVAMMSEDCFLCLPDRDWMYLPLRMKTGDSMVLVETVVLTAGRLPTPSKWQPELGEPLSVDGWDTVHNKTTRRPTNHFAGFLGKAASDVTIVNWRDAQTGQEAAPYKLDDFEAAMRALKCALTNKQQVHKGNYTIKTFHNTTNFEVDNSTGYFTPPKCSPVHLKCFPGSGDWLEMRILPEADTRFKHVDRCRFLFNVKTCRLYFTDCHYGEDLVPNWDDLTSWEQARALYELVQEIKNGDNGRFPFRRVGRIKKYLIDLTS